MRNFTRPSLLMMKGKEILNYYDGILSGYFGILALFLFTENDFWLGVIVPKWINFSCFFFDTAVSTIIRLAL